jgi:hypothetical protein
LSGFEDRANFPRQAITITHFVLRWPFRSYIQDTLKVSGTQVFESPFEVENMLSLQI